jgi:H/ACA ribonucleoprotein complex subunit 4
LPSFTDRFIEKGIELHEEIVLMTTKGEAVALAYAQMSAVEMSSCDHGVVARIKRVIMERDLYPRRWGLGPVATEKKKMKENGTLDVSSNTSHDAKRRETNRLQKFGRNNEKTPSQWQSGYKDYGAPAGESTGTVAETTNTSEVLAAPAIPPTGITAAEQADAGAEVEAAKSKKRKSHDDEAPEDKAERKKRKAEKKAEKERRKSDKVSKKAAKDDSDSD